MSVNRNQAWYLELMCHHFPSSLRVPLRFRILPLFGPLIARTHTRTHAWALEPQRTISYARAGG